MNKRWAIFIRSDKKVVINVMCLWKWDEGAELHAKNA